MAHPRSLVDLPEEPLKCIIGHLAFIDALHLPTHMIEEVVPLAVTCTALRKAVAEVLASKWPRERGQTRHNTKFTEEQLKGADMAQLQRWAKLLGAYQYGSEEELKARLAPLRLPAGSHIPPWLWAANYQARRDLMRARDAKTVYRMTDLDLNLLQDHRYSSTSMHQYRRHEVVAAARARFSGDVAWFEDRTRAPPPLSDDDKQAARERQVVEALQQQGIDQRYMERFKAFIEDNRGKVTHIIDSIMTEVYAERKERIKGAVAAAGLPVEYSQFNGYDYGSVFYSYYTKGGSEADLFEAVELQCARENRLWEVRGLLAAAGLPPDAAKGRTTNTLPGNSPFVGYIHGSTNTSLQVLMEKHAAQLARLHAIKVAAAAAGLSANYTQLNTMAFERTFGMFYRDGSGKHPDQSAKAVRAKLDEEAAAQERSAEAARAAALRRNHLPLRD